MRVTYSRKSNSLSHIYILAFASPFAPFFSFFFLFFHSSILRPFETQQRFSFRQGQKLLFVAYIHMYKHKKKMAEYVLLANNKFFTNRGRINYGNKVIRLLFKIHRIDQSVYPDEI